MIIDVVVRCRNEMPFTARTLSALASQRGCTARVLFLDCESTDGSREAAVAAGVRVVDIEAATYRPGQVLNLGMRRTDGDVVAFVNADAIPQGPHALRRLVEPLRVRPRLAATYGRQPARPDAAPLTKLDHARSFGEVPPPVRHGRFFSMAASAVRRDAWRQLPFDEALRYSEDVAWTRAVGALGWRVSYVPEARFEHSHDYDLAGQFRRRRGEGAADTRIHHLGRPSPWGDWLRPLGGAVLRDARAGLVSPHSVALRAAQATGFYAGRKESP